MKREFLKELGLEDETINKVMAEHGKTVNDIKDKADKVDTLESQINDYKDQLKDRDKQLDDLKEQAKGNEELQTEIDRLKDENETTKSDLEKKIVETQKRSKIEMAIKDAGAHDPDDVISKIDLETVKLDDGRLLGFDEQLNNIKENKAYLFKNDEEDKKRLGGRDPVPGGQGSNTGITKDQFNKMGYQERVELYQEDPDTYQKLTNE